MQGRYVKAYLFNQACGNLGGIQMARVKEEPYTYRIGADVGGTFTDLVLLRSDGHAVTRKVNSNKAGYHQPVLDGIKELLSDAGVQPSSIVEVCHGATVATNALIQRQGAITGLITTEGFRDVLELRRLRRPSSNDLLWDKPEPLVPRRRRLEVEERMSAEGEVLVALNEDAVRRAIDSLVLQGVESLAICFLNSPFNPAHEQAVARIVRAEYPSLSVSVSTEVFSAIREYERTSTAIVNAYVMPLVATYLDALRIGLKRMGIEAPLLIMGSNGGVITSRAAMQRPALVVESGPAAGVIGASHLAKQMKGADLVCMDMGGTTTKAALLEGGLPTFAPEQEVAGATAQASWLWQGGGYHLLGRCVDLSEIGAGGGSIISVDAAGGIKVGPRSAGASPGPVCYGTGGDEPTITDANVLTGYLNQEYLLGGQLALDIERTRRVFMDKVARPAGLSLEMAAHGVQLVAHSTMARAIGTVTTGRGRDVRDMDLCVFGGGGPVHAAGIADVLGIRRIIVPPSPGVFSAVGMLCSKPEMEFVRAYWKAVQGMSGSSLLESFGELEVQAIEALEAEGFARNRIELVRWVDAKYVDQVHDLMVPVQSDWPQSELVTKIASAFADEYERQYGHRSDGEPIQIVNLRVIGKVASVNAHGELSLKRLGESLYGMHPKKQSRSVYFGAMHGWITTPVVSRTDLTGCSTEGPLIVEEYDTTILVPPHFCASVDASWNVVIEIRKSAQKGEGSVSR